MPRVTEEHRAARRDQIIDAAMDRFADGGFHATGMAEVITASGLSAGAVYRYFASKEDLIRAIVEDRVLAYAAAGFEQIRDEGVDDPVEAVASALTVIDEARTRDGLDLTRVAVQAWSEAMRNPVIREIAAGAYTTMRGYLAEVAGRAQANGRVPADADPAELAKAMLSLVMGYMLQRLIIGDMDRDAYLTAARSLSTGAAVSRSAGASPAEPPTVG